MTGVDPELRVGRIVKAHGVKGAVRVELLSDFADRFSPGGEVEVNGRPFIIETAREEAGSLVVCFKEIRDRSAAEALTGLYCTVPLSAARPLPADRYYEFQLVGLSVFDRRRQRDLGQVIDVLSYAANDVLLVSHDGKQLLIPMIKAVVQAIEPDRGLITIDLPEEIEG